MRIRLVSVVSYDDYITITMTSMPIIIILILTEVCAGAEECPDDPRVREASRLYDVFD